ncbi:hypothetical protein M440DRAFT_1399190 [Trichoderma longibrachiatum ATCC 18648]|uniref:Uncharacterized protein n=1 Tax=Trichoderma longibrachiatum ATCC 18648 TaxID=983965 RepID=A0A2T4C8Z9_TRILO|nr:hypothetical protein M440DRAFT_1399190 [Trichoderma longibrachiatum ATCC 18648]
MAPFSEPRSPAACLGAKSRAVSPLPRLAAVGCHCSHAFVATFCKRKWQLRTQAVTITFLGYGGGDWAPLPLPMPDC